MLAVIVLDVINKGLSLLAVCGTKLKMGKRRMLLLAPLQRKSLARYALLFHLVEKMSKLASTKVVLKRGIKVTNFY